LDKNIFANKLHISENIKRARVSAGKTQAELASILGVSRSTYATGERGRVDERIKKVRNEF